MQSEHNKPTVDQSGKNLSIVLPAYNEAAIIGKIVRRLRDLFPESDIVVVDDKSQDDTAYNAHEAGARVVRHHYNMGNGAAIKTGARNALRDVIVFMDGDGQHDDRDIPKLLDKIEEGYELVIGARAPDTQANWVRALGNKMLNKFASLMTGFPILDLTSGFRAVRRKTFQDFIYLLPNGYSYPTTSTMAYLRSGLPVHYIPIRARSRVGKSKINLLKDGARFLVIIMKVTTVFSPMRIFLPVSLLFFLPRSRKISLFLHTNQPVFQHGWCVVCNVSTRISDRLSIGTDYCVTLWLIAKADRFRRESLGEQPLTSLMCASPRGFIPKACF